MTTLTTIETTTSTAFQINEPASNEDGENLLNTPASDDLPAFLFQKKKSLDGYPPVEPELLIVKSKPITATIRSTMKHLRAQAGRWSGFRGIGLAMVYSLLQVLLSAILSPLSPGLLAGALAFMAVNVVLSGLDMAWTHIVISAPSRRPWWRRIPSLDRVKVTILPTAIWTVAVYASQLLPYALLKAFSLESHLHDPSWLRDATPQVQTSLLAKLVLVILAALISYVLILVPATITLRRVQASMLPDEDEAIIPFDRTFNGKVQPVVAGGSGAVSMLDAWRTFDWPARIRYLKLQAKIMAIIVATSVWFVIWLAVEIVAFNSVGKHETESQNPAV